MSGIKRQALQAARSHSLNFRPDALEAAVEFTKQHHATGREPSDILLSLLSESKPLLSSSQVISIDVVQTAMQNLSEKWSATGSHITAFESINVFSVPKYQHDFATSNFVPYRPEKTTFQGTPQTVDGKTALMRARFELLKQRLLRDPKFDMRGDVAGESMAMEANDNVIAITPLGALLGSEGSKCVFGMLSKSERTQMGSDGNHNSMYYLEDLDSRVEIEFSLDTLSNGGFICEGCCVLADGVFMDGVFQVEAFAHPPTEPRITTQEHLQEVNLFGGDHYSTEAQEDELEEQLSRLMIIMSDVHLDNPTVMQKFRTLLEGYAMMEPPPSCFVLLGNFFSQPVGVSGGVGMQTAPQYFADLGAMVNEFPELVEATEFVLVPGPSDPGPTPGLIPRPPLPSCFTAGLREQLPSVHLGTNPCRVNYCGQQLVFFRDNIMHKMRRNLAIPAEVTPPAICDHHHMAKTILSQATLCPLPVTARPVHWGADHGLWLYPEPHLVVCADSAAQYAVPPFEDDGCSVLNPGSFYVDFGFSAFTPLTGEVEPCKVP